MGETAAGGASEVLLSFLLSLVGEIAAGPLETAATCALRTSKCCMRASAGEDAGRQDKIIAARRMAVAKMARDFGGIGRAWQRGPMQNATVRSRLRALIQCLGAV